MKYKVNVPVDQASHRFPVDPIKKYSTLKGQQLHTLYNFSDKY